MNQTDKFQTKKLVDTISWTASTEKELDLPCEGLITRIDLEFYVAASGSMASAMSSLGNWRIFDSLKIVGGGGKNYYSMSGYAMGVLQHYLNLVDFPGITWREAVDQYPYTCIRLHFGSRPQDIHGRDNPFDLTAAIPAFAETSLKLAWSCPAALALDDTVTISSATLRVTVHQVVNDLSEWAKFGKMIPVSNSETYTPGATKSDLSAVRDVPVGAYVRRIGILAEDDTTAGAGLGPLFVGDQVTEVGLFLVKENRWIIRNRCATMQNCGQPQFDGNNEPAGTSTYANTQLPYSQAGIYLLDLRQYGESRDYGVNAMGLQTGDIQLGMSITYAASEYEYIWYDQIQPWSGR